MSRRFKKVMIANRGEIAVRIAATLHEMDIVPVAIYSEVDRDSPHVSACAEAYPLGSASAAASYLNASKIVAVAQAAGVDAVHPGYGFLAENAAFAAQVVAAGMIFIGPSPAAMQVMGDKTRARAAMRAAGVPTVPGSDGALQRGRVGEAEAKALAEQMGYPVMLKAAAGGGGKGMRLIEVPRQLPSGLRAAASEAHNAFGDASVYIEKAIVQPRHIEVQIFCDVDGTAYFLGERECSLQRRHQKVIEEAPSVVLDAKLRQKMGEVACQAATAVGYRGAGTVEFLLDAGHNFYFLEMNTRLQVEHTVTEMCFGLDLVAAQVRVAQGEALGWRATELRSRGHAIQARLYAEDPQRNFMPSPGRIDAVVLPQGPGLRIDCGVAQGFEVSRHYDPMVAKVVCWGETREQARRRLRRALHGIHFGGIVTNAAFLTTLLDCPDFVAGAYHTATLAQVLGRPAASQGDAARDVELLAAAIATYTADVERSKPRAACGAGGDPYGAWRRASGRARSA